MPRRNRLLPAAVLVGAGLFVWMLIRLLVLRYDRGDVYPPYSTLRPDPLGARAYYEALDSLPGYTAARGLTTLRRELAQKPGTLFYLGLGADELFDLSREEVAQLDGYVKNGGRVVIAFGPVAGDELRRAQDETDDKRRKEKDDPSFDQPTLPALWGFTLERPDDGSAADADDSDSSDLDDSKPDVWATRSSGNELEPDVPWKSALYFVQLAPAWTTLYSAKAKPVLIHRALGKGEIIVASDSYFISNEALRTNRRPALLNLLAGPPGPLLFDETHLGIQEQEGVMFLAEKFRLEGWLYGLLAVLLLFLWRNSAPLVPPRPAGEGARLGGAVSGKDSRSGLVNLLRRNIAPGDILKTAFSEWTRHVTPARRHLHGRMTQMESILAAPENSRGGRIVPSYHQLREINTPGRAKGNYATKP